MNQYPIGAAIILFERTNRSGSKDFENYNKLCEIWGLDIVYSYCDLSIENL